MREFNCHSCQYRWQELLGIHEDYTDLCCPRCHKNDKEKLLSLVAPPVFTEPRGTSKEDSFSYVAGHNMENAKDVRRRAEKHSHMGNTDEFYRPIDDSHLDGKIL